MAYTKEIVCLANSIKTGGRCVAGQELNVGGVWIRPAVSSRPSAEVAGTEYLFDDGSSPQLLDTIKVSLNAPKPHAHQTENHIIDGVRWRKAGTLAYAQLAS